MYPRLTKTASNSLLEASSIVRVPSSLIRIAPVIHRLLESVDPNSSWSLSKRTVGTVMLMGLVGFDDRRRLIRGHQPAGESALEAIDRSCIHLYATHNDILTRMFCH